MATEPLGELAQISEHVDDVIDRINEMTGAERTAVAERLQETAHYLLSLNNPNDAPFVDLISQVGVLVTGIEIYNRARNGK